MKNSVYIEKTFPVLMTQQELKNLGLDQVGYIKAYKQQGKIAWVLHAADGTALAVQNDAQAARVSAQHNDINLVAVH